MVAKITIPNSIKRALNYNEQKVKEGKAECIHAQGFLQELPELNFYSKLQRFEKLTELNKRAVTNTIHISLNFALNERLGREKLVEIADVYMQKIGFGEQPYLVYRHLDAGHPHIHIVTTNIQANGKRISTHNLGRNQSSKARKEIEVMFGLVKAEAQQKIDNEIKPVAVQKVIYGKSATHRGIANVLDAVLPHYHYSSLPELNAVLRLYNLVADRGREDGLIFRKHGLIYRLLDEKGYKIGVPIKASLLHNKPTLAFLEKRFKENEQIKYEHRKRLKTSLDWILLQPMKSIAAFKQALEKEKVNLVIRQNEQNIIYGLTYIDHRTKCVFNGSDIGKQYSAKAILERCGIQQALSNKNIAGLQQQITPHISKHITHAQQLGFTQTIDDVITPVDTLEYLPFELKKQKRKKKKID